MKRFQFPLGRVLDWRRTQERIEQAKLEQAHAEVRKIETQIKATLEQRAAAERALMDSGSVTGAELSTFATFSNFMASEHARLNQLAAASRKRAALQAGVVVQERGKVRLLERMEEHKRTAWRAELNKEAAAQAEEAHVAKINAERDGNRWGQ